MRQTTGYRESGKDDGTVLGDTWLCIGTALGF